MAEVKKEFQATVFVEKMKNNIPTVIKVNGETYILQHKQQYKPKMNHKNS